jgi:hypothetical protein
MEKLLTKLKRFIALNGYAKTAYLLGHRDTHTIKKWLQRGIPEQKEPVVRDLLK